MSNHEIAGFGGDFIGGCGGAGNKVLRGTAGGKVGVAVRDVAGGGHIAVFIGSTQAPCFLLKLVSVGGAEFVPLVVATELIGGGLLG